MSNENEKKVNETARAEEKINEYFYGEEENTPHTTDYMNNETAAINIAKPERENE